MQNTFLIFIVLFTAFLFYGLIPGIGAFTVRAHWRKFRKRILEVSLFPFVQYSDLESPGKYRIFGSLEAIQDQNRIWINNGKFSLEVDLKGVKIYILPSYSPRDSKLPFEKLEETLPDQQPKSVPWSRIYSLPAGTRVFVGGWLVSEHGRSVFRFTQKEPLVVVIYDGGEQSILLRAIWGGRQKNEYWNSFTFASLITGSFFLLFIAYIFLKTPLYRMPSIIALSFGFFPLALLLPPGVVLNFLYRYLWKMARLLRAERDMLRLPLRYFTDNFSENNSSERIIQLPTHEQYIMTQNSTYLISDELNIRGSSLLNASEAGGEDYYLFGAYTEQGGEPSVHQPEDPMAELVLILGNPDILSNTCSKKARYFELLSAAAAFSGIAINLFILLSIWHNIIR